MKDRTEQKYRSYGHFGNKHEKFRGKQQQKRVATVTKHTTLAYGGWARSTSESQKLTVYGNDTIIVFFFEANKNKDNAIIALASSNN